MAKAFCDEKIASTDIFMISKSYCPFCTKAKKALDSIGAKYEVLEIENRKGEYCIEFREQVTSEPPSLRVKFKSASRDFI